MATPLAEQLDRRACERMARWLGAVMPDVDTGHFVQRSASSVSGLPLKARVDALILQLHAVLPPHYPDAAALLTRLPTQWSAAPEEKLRTWRDYAAWPLIDYHARYGLEYPELALPLLGQLSEGFTAEFALRPFWQQHPDATLAHLRHWVSSPNPHQRRLVSEGSRPRLPWATHLHHPPARQDALLMLLEQLLDDPWDNVRRSVANHLNDLAKSDPQTVLDCCQRWQQPANRQRQRLLKHATRRLSAYPIQTP